MRLDVDVPGHERPVGDRDVVAERAVMGHVGGRHQEVVAAQSGHTVLLLGAAVDGHPLADRIVVTDLHPRRCAPIGKVLRRTADGDERAQRVELAEFDHPHQADVTEQLRPSADLYPRADDAPRADDCVLRQPRTRIDPGRRRDQTRHEQVPC